MFFFYTTEYLMNDSAQQRVNNISVTQGTWLINYVLENTLYGTVTSKWIINIHQWNFIRAYDLNQHKKWFFLLRYPYLTCHMVQLPSYGHIVGIPWVFCPETKPPTRKMLFFPLFCDMEVLTLPFSFTFSSFYPLLFRVFLQVALADIPAFLLYIYTLR